MSDPHAAVAHLAAVGLCRLKGCSPLKLHSRKGKNKRCGCTRS